MTKVWVVEDDENILELVLYALKAEDMEARGFDSSANFWSALSFGLPDLVLLDIMLPGEDGISILKRLMQSKTTEEIPVIMLTARGSEYDRVKGLDLGADDYIVKPFSMLELISRIRAVLRRKSAASRQTTDGQILDFEDIRLDPDRHTVAANEKSIELTFKEFELLQYFMLNPEIVLTREKILTHIWEFDYEGETRTVDMHIKTLRQKLGEAGDYIKTVRSVGYKLAK